MRNVLRVAAVISAAVLSAASATAPQAHDVQAETTVKASYDDAWGAVVDIFSERNWVIQTTEKASGVIATDWQLLDLSGQDEKYADCGSAPLATDVAAGVRFNVRVKDESGGAVVRVNAVFRKIRRVGSQHGTISCTSRGVLEREIQDEVAVRVASHRTHRKDDERKIVTGDKPVFCNADGACVFDETKCEGSCERRESAACFSASRTLDDSRTTTCVVSVKDCEARRATAAKDADLTKIQAQCAVYRVKPDVGSASE